MPKTLKDFLEVYKPKSPDEQKFVDKHVVIKHKDRNGNGDDVFNAAKIKIGKRKEERHGYDVGEDEKVYEALKGDQHKIDANKNGKVDAHDFHLLRKKKKVAEEAEPIDELSHDTLRRYRMKAKSIADHGGEQRTKGRELAGSKSYGGRVPGIEKAKVMASEEAEQVDETSKPGYFRVSIPNKATTYHNADHAAHARELAQNHHDNPPAEVAARRRDDYKNLDFSKASVRRLGDKVNLKSKFSKEEVEIEDLLDEALELLNAVVEGKMPAADEPTDANKKTAQRIRDLLAKEKKPVKEESEDLDESAKIAAHLIKRYGDNVRKSHVVSAANDFGVGYTGLAHAVRKKLGVVRLEEENDDGWYTHNEMHGKVSKEHWKKGWRYNNLKDKPFYHQPTKTWHASIKEEVNPAHYDIAGLIKKAKAKGDPKHPAMKHVAAIEDIKKHGGALSVHGDHVRSLIKALGEEVQIEEGEEKGGGYDGMPKGLEDRAPRGRARNAMGRAIAKKERNLARARMDRAAEMKKEEVEAIDEISNDTMHNYVDKASDARGHRNLSTKKVDNRYAGVKKASDKLTKEEVEAIDELSKKTMGSYINKAAERIGTKGVSAGLMSASYDEKSSKNFKDMGKRQKGIARAVGKLTKEDIINRTIEKYVPEDLKFTPEERLLKRLNGLSEAHINTMLGLFEDLNKDNQNKMIETVSTEAGINQILNFVLENRGK